MNRRKFTIIATLSGLNALAGCTDLRDDVGPDENGEDTPEDTPTPTPEDEDTPEEAETDEAADSIDAARSDIQAAIDILNETIEDDDLTLDSEQFFGDLDAAALSLDEAEPAATDEQLETIDELRTFIDFVALRGEILEAADEGFEAHLATGLDHYWDGRDQYEDVTVSTLQTAEDRFDDADQAFMAAESAFERGESTTNDAQEVLDDVDPEVAGSFEGVSYDDFVDDLNQTHWFLGQMQPFAVGCAEGSQGWHHVSTGFIAFEEERWVDGEDAFEDANTAFDSAVGSLETVHEEVLETMSMFFDEMLCELGEGPDATDHWIAAAEEAQALDQEGHEDEVEAGWELINACLE